MACPVDRNRRVWRNGKAIEACEGVEFAGEDEHYYRFSVEPGTWVFRAV